MFICQYCICQLADNSNAYLSVSPLSSLVSTSPLMLPLLGIYFLKTLVHHPRLPLLERSSKPISTQRLILLSSFSFMASPWCQPISVPGLCILLLFCCALESTTQWRLSAIKVELELLVCWLVMDSNVYLPVPCCLFISILSVS